MAITRSRWFLPAFAVLMGGVMSVALLIGDDPTGAVISLAVMTGFAAVVLFGGRSETIRGLRGDGRDERFRAMDVQATAFAGLVVCIAIIAGFLYEVARGHSGSPYVGLGVVFGLAYVAAIVAIRLRG
jgi:hypothetical protein